MMESEVLKLQAENQYFRRLAERDRLTGLYNRGTVEEKINEQLAVRHEGVLLVLDVDDFKKVNDQYGHFMGDDLLRSIADNLRSMFLKIDIIGRIGGDEFIVFLSIKQDESFAAARAKQVKAQLKTLEVQKCQLTVSVTVGYSVFQEKDDYQSLFVRADQMLIEKKQQRKGNKARRSLLERGVEMDILRIKSDLQESQPPKGAYFQDYESFKRIYRFVERRLQRLDTGAYIVLMTLTDGGSHFLPLKENMEGMELLKVIIEEQLRAGDTFTQYSSCQYLIMLADVWGSESETIAGRITTVFYQRARPFGQDFLLHYCYPLDGSSKRRRNRKPEKV